MPFSALFEFDELLLGNIYRLNIRSIQDEVGHVAKHLPIFRGDLGLKYTTGALVTLTTQPSPSTLRARLLLADFVNDLDLATAPTGSEVSILRHGDPRMETRGCCPQMEPLFFENVIARLRQNEQSAGSQFHFVAVTIEGVPGVAGVIKTKGEPLFLALKTFRTPSGEYIYQGAVYSPDVNTLAHIRGVEYQDASRLRVLRVGARWRMGLSINRFLATAQGYFPGQMAHLIDVVTPFTARQVHRSRWQRWLSGIDESALTVEGFLTDSP